MSDTQTLNEEIGGLVSTDNPGLVPDQTNLISDIDNAEIDASSAADDKTPVDDGKDKGGNGKEAGEEQQATPEDQKKGEDTRFDKHPDWQRMLKERDEAKIEAARLQGMMEAMKKEDKATPKEEDLPYRNISEMSEEDLLEWQADDPKGFAKNLEAMVTHRMKTEFERLTQERQQQSTQEQEQSKIRETYERFEQAHPEFRTMWDSGELVNYIESHPGHNAISAYHELTEEKRIAEAVEKARKEASAEVEKRFKSKERASVLTGSPSASALNRGEQADQRLTNTKQFGGIESVLAQRLAERRKG